MNQILNFFYNLYKKCHFEKLCSYDIFLSYFFMEYKIWEQMIQISLYRNELFSVIKLFLINLKNNTKKEEYNIKDEKHQSFIRTLPISHAMILYSNKIIENNRYPIFFKESEIKKILRKDNIEGLKAFLRDNGNKPLTPIKASFNEVETISIPIIIYSIIEKATKCFKYLLINEIEEPTVTMEQQHHQFRLHRRHRNSKKKEDQYKWDCMSIAIYYGQVEIMKILEEKGIEKGKNLEHIAAAILSYRNSMAKSMINQMFEDDDNEMARKALIVGISTASKNNNINAFEMLLKLGMKQQINEHELLRSKSFLNLATQFRSKQFIELLLLKGANINIKDILYSRRKDHI